MPDSSRAVEVIAREPGGGFVGYGSGYRLGAGLVLTCAHILVADGPTLETSIQDTSGNAWPVTLAWCNYEHDVALLRLVEPGLLADSPVPLGILPAVTTGAGVDFVMWGWPRAGDVPCSGRKTVRDAVQVDGEIKLAELAASKTGLVRLRPQESYPALTDGTYWSGMSGAAVHCQGHIVGVQRMQPDARLPGYLMARPLGGPVLELRDGDACATELLEEAGIPLRKLDPEEMSPRSIDRGGANLMGPQDGGGKAVQRRIRAARPYLLLETGRVVGRTELREQIGGFIAEPSGDGLSLLLLVGVAGIGKSALAWDLWKQLRARSDQAGRGLFWYSFYDGRGIGSFQRLLDELGRFLDIETSPVGVEDVLIALAEHPTVLVLDGIERCLRCYQRTLAVGDLDAIQVQETDAVEWVDRDLAFSTEEVFQFFLQILELPDCQTLATSRVVPSDYLASGGALRSGVRVEHVGALSVEECRTFLDSVGLTVEQRLSDVIANTFGGHPLALQLFARRASRSPVAQHNIDAWMRQEGYALAAGKGAADIRRHLFAGAASELSSSAREALVTVGALGGELDRSTLFEIFASEDFTEEQFEAVMEELARSGLCVITADREIACHALTALAASDQLEPTRHEQLARRISEELKRRFYEIDDSGDGYYSWFTTRGVSDRVEAFTLCRALTGLGHFSEAVEVYQEQLDLPIRYILGANLEAIELISKIVEGLEQGGGEESAIEWLRGQLAHHLLMAGRVGEADALVASVAEVSPSADVLCIGAEAAFHLGRFEDALRLATSAMHRARSELNYAGGYDYSGFQLMGGKQLLDMGAPSARFIEAAVLCARTLFTTGRQAEAAMLLAEAIAVSRSHHSQCDGCRGLILRCCAEMMVLGGAQHLGMDVAAHGKRLQESQGKALQGLLSEVVVWVRATIDSSGDLQPDRELLDSLSDGGFILYQLMLEGAIEQARASSAAGQAGAPSRVHRELAAVDARYAMGLLGVDGGHRDALSSDAVARSVGWLLEHNIEGRGGSPEPASKDEEREPLELAVSSWLDDAFRQGYSDQSLDRIQGALDGQVSIDDRVEGLDGILSLLPAWDRIEADRKVAEGRLEDARPELRRVIELDPCDARSLRRLAMIAAEAGEYEDAFSLARRALQNASSSFASYDFVTRLVPGQGAFADEVRELLAQFAWDDHASPAAYLALANLERRLGRRREAYAWHEQGLGYPATFLGEPHRVAHYLGLITAGGRRNVRSQSLGMNPKAEVPIIYLLKSIVRGRVPSRRKFLAKHRRDPEVTEELYEEACEWMVGECRCLEGGEAFVELLATSK